VLALLSVSDKQGLAQFARELTELGFSLLSTGGTFDYLSKEGIAARKVSEHTGAAEILGGRVKTLHPRIFGGILARPGSPSDRAELERERIEPISLVAVNFYPFQRTVAAKAEEAEAIEQIDIGGPAMVRAAAKNFAHLAVVVDPADYPMVLAELRGQGAVTEATRRSLMRKAFAHTAAYDAAICAYLSSRAADLFPSELSLSFEKAQQLRYGENPHQRASFYRQRAPSDGPTVAFSRVLQGKELSYNNLLDLDAARWMRPRPLVGSWRSIGKWMNQPPRPCAKPSWRRSLPQSTRRRRASCWGPRKTCGCLKRESRSQLERARPRRSS
jgi:phosphoribosylaminoimidazolecarboxamide formyltransferase/IMP cyclohydrolase